MQQTPRFDTALMRQDLDAKGWQPADLAERAGVARSTVSRFLDGRFQTARTAKKLATAIGYSPRRYVLALRRETAQPQEASA